MLNECDPHSAGVPRVSVPCDLVLSPVKGQSIPSSKA